MSSSDVRDEATSHPPGEPSWSRSKLKAVISAILSPLRLVNRSVDLSIAFVVACLAFGIFLVCPRQQVSDSLYTLLLSEQLLTHGTFELDAYFEPHVDSRGYPGVRKGRFPRHVQPLGVRHGERRGVEGPLFYVYPPATSILSVPALYVGKQFGLSVVSLDGRYQAIVEVQLQRWIAALLMGLAVAMFFLIARRWLGVGWSLAVAAWGGLATPVWSTASRGLWSHTWDVLFLAIALLHLIRSDEDQRSLRPVFLATVLSWGYFTRPTAVFYILPICLFVLVKHRRRVVPFVATGAAWLGLLVGYSVYHFGSWLPDYYLEGRRFQLENWWTGFLAQTVSPSRGLLVQIPMLLLIGLVLIRYRQRVESRGLVAVVVVALVSQLVIVSAFANYWAGHCFGPRLFTDLVPCMVLLVAIAVKAATGTATVAARRWFGLVFAGLFLVGAVIHGVSAWSERANLWNAYPPLAKNSTRIFDWSQPQWACGLSPDWCPPEIVEAEGER